MKLRLETLCGCSRVYEGKEAEKLFAESIIVPIKATGGGYAKRVFRRHAVEGEDMAVPGYPPELNPHTATFVYREVLT